MVKQYPISVRAFELAYFFGFIVPHPWLARSFRKMELLTTIEERSFRMDILWIYVLQYSYTYNRVHAFFLASARATQLSGHFFFWKREH